MATSDIAQTALRELEDLRAESQEAGWNGYGSLPVTPGAYETAKAFLSTFPPAFPAPEIAADPDGDVALDWVFGHRKALSVSLGPADRCTFAFIRGQSTFRGTDWLEHEVPASILFALSQLACATEAPCLPRGI